MSNAITVASLTYIRPQDLASELRSSSNSTTAVVDVRDNDYLGGHIKGSVHAPCNQFDARLPELLRTLQDKRRVVFHCMLSQQRGPWAALKYARAKAEQAARQGLDAELENDSVAGHESKGIERPTNDGNRVSTSGRTQELSIKRIGGQEICILEGGFGQWQSRYGADKDLTEGYVKELWESAFA